MRHSMLSSGRSLVRPLEFDSSTCVLSSFDFWVVRHWRASSLASFLVQFRTRFEATGGSKQSPVAPEFFIVTNHYEKSRRIGITAFCSSPAVT